MTGPHLIEIGLRGAAHALVWAWRFYLAHGWPLLALAAVPVAVRVALALRRQQQMRAPGASESTEGLAVLWRGVLMLAIAGLDLTPSAPWWESIWPGSWTQQLAGRLGAMSGRELEWLALWAGIALIILLIAGLLRLLTTPQLLVSVMSATGMPLSKARRRSEAIGHTVGNLVTIPVTTLLMYAAVARAALCLRP